MCLGWDLLGNTPTACVFWGAQKTVGDFLKFPAMFTSLWALGSAWLGTCGAFTAMMQLFSTLCALKVCLCAASVSKYMQRYLRLYKYTSAQWDQLCPPKDKASCWHVLLRYLCCDMVLTFVSLLLIIFHIQPASQLNWKCSVCWSTQPWCLRDDTFYLLLDVHISWKLFQLCCHHFCQKKCV